MLPIGHPRFRPAMQLIDEAQYAEAVRQLDELTAGLSGKDRAIASYWKGVCLGRLGRFDDGMACIENALSSVERDSALGICLQLQVAFLQKYEVPEADIAAIRSVLNRYARRFSTPDFRPQYVDAKTAIGKRLLRLGRYSEGIAEIEQIVALERRPDLRYKGRVWLSSAYYKVGDLDKAKAHLVYALKDADGAVRTKLPGDHPAQIRYELALIAYKQQHWADAERELALASAVAQNQETLRVISKLRDLLDQHNSERRRDT
jgi:tetratricopeptide (TPR) repeat protein